MPEALHVVGECGSELIRAVEEELAKAGVSAADMINGGLKGSLALVAAGQIAAAEATSIASSAMTQFGLSGIEDRDA